VLAAAAGGCHLRLMSQLLAEDAAEYLFELLRGYAGDAVLCDDNEPKRQGLS
jgi:hypothetical protein